MLTDVATSTAASLAIVKMGEMSTDANPGFRTSKVQRLLAQADPSAMCTKNSEPSASLTVSALSEKHWTLPRVVCVD